ncbi:MAG: glycosyltransferase family 4 protein [Coriobacteriia bacterium]|nr:glycosyltransferase family 4 protein [Coriobacteriia bacterium]
MNPSKISTHPDFGVNLFGYLTSNLGLGVAARNTAHMLLTNGIPSRFIDVNPGGGMQGKDSTFAEKIAADRRVEPYVVNLFHINPDQMLYLLNPFKNTVALSGRINACVPFWELPRLPDAWVKPLAAMDVVFAPTHFVEAAVRDSLPDANVIHYPQAVHVPGDITPDRAAFNLPDDALIFVMSFDMRSDIERKNPWAAIEAFLQAFPEREDVRLVIKASNVETIRGLERNVTHLREVAADPRIIVLDRPMNYREVLTLYASSDVLVSLHRSEGLGLNLLEAMALGKPVIATAWSGNMDFMTAENSCPVSFKLIDVVSSTQPIYSKGISGKQQWADPSVDEAAAWMRRLAESSELRASLGHKAATDARALTACYDSGNAIVSALETLKPDTVTAAHMTDFRRAYFRNEGKRIARAIVHRIRTRLGVPS